MAYRKRAFTLKKVDYSIPLSEFTDDEMDAAYRRLIYGWGIVMFLWPSSIYLFLIFIRWLFKLGGVE